MSGPASNGAPVHALFAALLTSCPHSRNHDYVAQLVNLWAFNTRIFKFLGMFNQ